MTAICHSDLSKVIGSTHDISGAEVETMMIGVRRNQPFSYNAFRVIQQGVDANLEGHALSK